MTFAGIDIKRVMISRVTLVGNVYCTRVLYAKINASREQQTSTAIPNTVLHVLTGYCKPSSPMTEGGLSRAPP